MDPVTHESGHTWILACTDLRPSTLVGPPPHLIWGAAGASPRVASTRPSTLVGPPPHLIWGAAGASPRVAITRNVALVQGCARGSDAGAHTIGARVRVGAGQAIIAGRA